MSSFHVPENQTVCWSVYNQAIANETRLPNDFLTEQAPRIVKAFDRGEPIWMICDELKIVWDTRPTWKPMKTPRQLAVRVVQF